MKRAQKDEIRLFILTLLKEAEDTRWKLGGLAETYDICPAEAMEFFESEVGRIEKLFNYPDIRLREAQQ